MKSVFKYCIFLITLELIAPLPTHEGDLLNGDLLPSEQQYFTVSNPNVPGNIVRYPPRLIHYDNPPSVLPRFSQGTASSPLTLYHELSTTPADISSTGLSQHLTKPREWTRHQNVAEYVPRNPMEMMQIPQMSQQHSFQNPSLTNSYPAPLQYKYYDDFEYGRDTTTERPYYPVDQQQPMMNRITQENWVQRNSDIPSTNNLAESKGNDAESILNIEKHSIIPNTDPIKNLYDHLNAQFENKPHSPEYNVRHLLLNNPAIRSALTPSHATGRKRYIVVHSDGTLEHVEQLEKVAEQFPNYILVKAGLQPNISKPVPKNIATQATSNKNSPRTISTTDIDGVPNLNQKKPYPPVNYQSSRRSTDWSTKTGQPLEISPATVSRNYNNAQSQHWPKYTQTQLQTASNSNPSNTQPNKAVVPQKTNTVATKKISVYPVNPTLVQNHHWSPYSLPQVPESHPDKQNSPVHQEIPEKTYSNQQIQQKSALNTQVSTSTSSTKEKNKSNSVQEHSPLYPQTTQYHLPSSSQTPSEQQTTTIASVSTSGTESQASSSSTIVDKSSTNTNQDTQNFANEMSETLRAVADKANLNIQTKTISEINHGKQEISSNNKLNKVDEPSRKSDSETDEEVTSMLSSSSNSEQRETDSKITSVESDNSDANSEPIVTLGTRVTSNESENKPISELLTAETKEESASMLSSSSYSEQQSTDSTNTSVECDSSEENNETSLTSGTRVTETRVKSDESETSSEPSKATYDEPQTQLSEIEDQITASEISTDKALELLFTTTTMSQSEQEKEDENSAEQPFEWFSTADPDFWSKLLGDDPSTVVYFFQAPSKSKASPGNNENIESSECDDDEKPLVSN